MTRRIDEAIRIIKMNDRGSFTLLTNRLYPHQWNWDPGFTALGICYFNRRTVGQNIPIRLMVLG